MEKQHKEVLYRWSLPTCDGATPIYYGDDPTTQEVMIPLMLGLDRTKTNAAECEVLIKERFGLISEDNWAPQFTSVLARSKEEAYEKIAVFNKAMVLASLDIQDFPIRETFKVPGVVNIQDLCHSKGVKKWEEEFAQMALKRLS